MAEIIIELAPSVLRPSPTNPHKRGRGIDDLVESVRTHGVLEPIVARALLNPLDGITHEIVFGERRWSAANVVGCVVPTIVRDLNDDEVLEHQIVENAQRSDVHPLDEADGFIALIKRGYTIDRIAERIGRDARYVAARARLADLSKAARKALESGAISLAVALLIAKLPNATTQDRALEEVALDEHDLEEQREPMNARRAKDIIEREVMLSLKDAPFPIDDPDLVPRCGPCTTCPNRTGAQGLLFDATTPDDLCLDATCYREKSEAFFAIRVKKHKAEGGAVLTKAQTKEVLGDGKDFFSSSSATRSGSDFERLDHERYLSNGKRKTVKQILGKELPPITLAQDPKTGSVVELVKKSLVDAALKKAKPDDAGGASKKKKGPSKEELHAKVRKLATERAIAALVAKVEQANELSEKLLDVIVLGQLDRFGAERVVKRRKLVEAMGESLVADANTKKGKPKRSGLSGSGRADKPTDYELLESLIPRMSFAEKLGLLVELEVTKDAPDRWSGDGGPAWSATLHLFKLKLETFEAQVEKELAAQAAEKAAKATGVKRAPPKKARAKVNGETVVAGVTGYARAPASKGKGKGAAKPSKAKAAKPAKPAKKKRMTQAPLFDEPATAKSKSKRKAKPPTEDDASRKAVKAETKAASKKAAAPAEPPHACRVCGCTDEAACPGGCHWVAPDLCSKCVAKVKPKRASKAKANGVAEAGA